MYLGCNPAARIRPCKSDETMSQGQKHVQAMKQCSREGTIYQDPGEGYNVVLKTKTRSARVLALVAGLLLYSWAPGNWAQDQCSPPRVLNARQKLGPGSISTRHNTLWVAKKAPWTTENSSQDKFPPPIVLYGQRKYLPGPRKIAPGANFHPPEFYMGSENSCQDHGK